jgi:predicted DNA-binding ribbon-helix-helix protein
LMQLKEALSKITATVADQKRRTTRETLYRHGQRISLKVEEQMGQMLTDIAKETEPTTQQLLKGGTRERLR